MTTTIVGKMSVFNKAIDGGEGYEFDIIKAVKNAFKEVKLKSKKTKKAS